MRSFLFLVFAAACVAAADDAHPVLLGDSCGYAIDQRPIKGRYAMDWRCEDCDGPSYIGMQDGQILIPGEVDVWWSYTVTSNGCIEIEGHGWLCSTSVGAVGELSLTNGKMTNGKMTNVCARWVSTDIYE